MEGNDIAPYAAISVVSLWEGVLASPPPVTRRRWRNPFGGEDHSVPIKDWEPHELPLKTVVDCINRRGINVDVATCLGERAVEDIDRWLQKKGIFTTVQGWDSIDAMAKDLRFNPGPRAIFVASWDQARIVGFRATVAAANQELPL